VAEWLNAPVLKTGNGRPFVSSNLTASAKTIHSLWDKNQLITSSLQPLICPLGILFPCLERKEYGGNSLEGLTMWFKNAIIFQYELEATSAQLHTALLEKKLKPCPPHARLTTGWLPAIGDEMMHEIAGTGLICMGKEERILPRGVIHKVLHERIQQLETQQARTLKRSEKKQLAEDIEFELLPKSFCVQKKLFAILDQKNKQLIINTSSPTQASQLISLLKSTITGLHIEPLPYPESLARRFGGWIQSPSTLPSGFQLASDCILIHCKGYELPADEVLTLLSQGMATAEVSFIWQEKIQFTLTHDFIFKKLKSLDYLVDEFNEIKQLDEAYQQADAALTLVAGELRTMCGDFLSAFEVEVAEQEVVV
jgi:recombination associated protein RdgC